MRRDHQLELFERRKGEEKSSAETVSKRRGGIDIPNSFLVKLSNCTPSENLYVSQHTTTGTECRFAIIATKAVPALENTAPLECRECAPTRTVDTSLIIEPSAGRRRYVHWIPAAASFASNRLPV